MKTIYIQSIFLLLFIFHIAEISAQNVSDTTKKVVVVMQNGESFTGKIISKNNEKLILKTENGELNLKVSNIKSISINDYNGNYSFSNPTVSNYYLGQSAIPIKAGTGYYENIMISSQIFDVGITNNISMGGGVELISLFLGYPIWFLTPKVAFNISDYFHVGLGALMLGIDKSKTEYTAELGYGVITIGNSDYNISASLGEGYANKSYTKYPQLMLNGTCRLSNRIGLLSENYLIFTTNGNLNFLGIEGFRLMSRESSFDFGLTIIKNEPFPIPIVTYSHNF